MGKKITARILPILGLLFLTAYIRSATVDVVYTDYMRLINSYLPNVYSLKPYLQGDVLTRMPINYIERIINVGVFGYSTTFDMILGALGLTFIALVIGSFAAKKNISAAGILALIVIVFSLDKWEMLTNGSGWVHFWAMGLFYYHYLVYDRVRSGESKKGDEIKLCVLPIVTILLFAGPYCAIYVGAMLVVYVIDLVGEKACERDGLGDRECCSDGRCVGKCFWVSRLLTLLIPFALYIISRAFSVEEYAGATTESLGSVLADEPMLLISMGLKSFAADVIGGETVTAFGMPDVLLWILGTVVIAGYVYAIIVNFKSGLYKKTAMPMLLILSGLVSHGVVLISRWIFLDDMYAMSSRYALQYMSGVLGIILTFVMVSECKSKHKAGCRCANAAAWALIIVFLAGHLITTGREIHMAQYRKENFVIMCEVAIDYENRSDEELKSILQYHSPAKTRQALTILKDNKLNVFK